MSAFRLLSAILVTAAIMVPAARADEVSDLKTQLDTLKKQMEQMQQQLEKVDQKASAPAPALVKPATPTAAAAPPPPNPGDGSHSLFERKPGPGLTFYSYGGEFTIYGNLDVSIDDTTKGLSGTANQPGGIPVGRVGWLPALSTNSSYIGLRGFETIGSLPFNFVWQLETQIDLTATSGVGESGSNDSNAVKGGLTSRNSYIGLASSTWGAIKAGKSDAPYKNSTQALNPFAGKLGDYSVVMGNTGGDNRVEFGTRLDHSIWYESPNLGGFSFNVQYAPGQNRASDSDGIAAGESDCTGGNNPGSGGTFTTNTLFSVGGTPNFDCSDGSFSDAVSANIAFKKGPFYITAAYERHFDVNRASDITGILANNFTPFSQHLQAEDVADEDAAKIGIQYVLPTRTTISAIVEDMHRYVPNDLQFQNERQRWGTWLAVSQQVTDRDSVHVGWAHAFRTPGDPGQHNDSVNPVPNDTNGDTTGGTGANNQANLFTLLLVHQFTPAFSIYFNYAATVNGPDAHYDLGAGGRGVTTDCHDAFSSNGGNSFSAPHCFTGSTLQGVSLGMDWKF
ncbi:MAG TPA: porin [Stellaceae bacterium]|nr:porin [Stellaceae bacterium]